MEDFISNLTGGSSQKTGYPAGGGVSHGPDEDFNNAAQHASNYADGSGDHGLFSSVLGSIGSRKEEVAQGDINEEDAVRSHQKFFGNGDDGSEATSSSMGTAAAMQAMKMFTGGGQGGGSSQSQSQFIGLAMAQASKLFEQQAGAGRVSSGADKSSAIQSAGEMALKMYAKSQMGGSGGFNVMSLASKLM